MQFNSICPYQMLPLRTRVDLGAMTVMGTPHSPKFQHYWSLTITMFCVIFRLLVVGVITLCREADLSNKIITIRKEYLKSLHFKQIISTKNIYFKLRLFTKRLLFAILDNSVNYQSSYLWDFESDHCNYCKKRISLH